MKRKISALLAADIVKYSRLVADDEEQTVHRLADYRAVFEEVTARHGGRIVNMVGDAVLADFPSSVDAVRCALDVQSAIGEHNRAYPDDRRMQLRIGVTLADIMDKEGELFGDGVNIAARLESLAPPGGICVSQTVREQVAGKLPVIFTDIGPQRVKNIPTPIHAYVFVLQAQAGAGARGAGRWKGLTSRRGRLLAGAGALVVAFAASIVAAVQFGGPSQAPARWSPASLASQPAATAQAAIRFDGEKVRALADKQGIPLPTNLKVLVPTATVPAGLAKYLGAWGGERRWTPNGRQVMLIVESVDESGTALGFFANSVPLVPNVNNNSAHFVPFAAALTDAGLRFVWGQAKYTFHLRPDGAAMFGELEMPNSRHFSIVLDRIE